MTTKENLGVLKTMAALTDRDIDVKEIINDWILLTYDIPGTPEGTKARYKFLREARRIGAIPQTESVYLMPWSIDADFAALEVAAAGHAYVWYSQAKDDETAKKATIKYDEVVDKLFTNVEKRMDKILDHVDAKRYGQVARMLEKTIPMIDGLEQAAVCRGSLSLWNRVKEIREKYQDAVTNIGV